MFGNLLQMNIADRLKIIKIYTLSCQEVKCQDQYSFFSFKLIILLINITYFILFS